MLDVMGLKLTFAFILSRRYNRVLGPPKFFRLHWLGFLPPKIAGSRSNLCAASVSICLWRAIKEQYVRMVAEGLGELDKSGIAELTFKG